MDNLPEMSGYKARSFWLMLFASILPIMKTFGFDLEEFGLTSEKLSDLVMTLLPVFLALWAYVERLYGKKKLLFIPK